MKTLVLIILFLSTTIIFAESKNIVRYQQGSEISYGELINNIVHQFKGSPFSEYKLTGKKVKVSEVELLIPTEPQKVFAVGMNFASHISSPSDEAPPLFLKLPTSLIATDKDIQIPKDANNVHFEGELVLIIGKKTKNISVKEAPKAIFGVTAGNDLTERTWQGTDLQWMRSKASDGFGPVAPTIAVGVDYNNVLLTTRLNGKVVQQENTSHMIHSPAKVVSYLSRYFTLMPGDMIFMGTPGRTQALNNGDVVSVTIDKVGSVKNTIRKPK